MRLSTVVKDMLVFSSFFGGECFRMFPAPLPRRAPGDLRENHGRIHQFDEGLVGIQEEEAMAIIGHNGWYFHPGSRVSQNGFRSVFIVSTLKELMAG